MTNVLNVGCGSQKYGTHRVDMFETPTTTEVVDLNQKWPYPDNYFDKVYANCILEHIKNLDNFSSECYRVLKTKGQLYVHTDNAAYLPFHIFKSHEHNAFLKNQYKSGTAYGHTKEKTEIEDWHYHLFVASHLNGLFRKFRNQKISYTYGGRSKLFTFILKLLPKRIGAIGITLEAVK